jgi:cell division transport system permease protein
MSWAVLKRVFRAGVVDFWRNGFVSFASVLMMIFTLFIIGLAIFTGVILNSTLEEFRSKADMNVYFTTDAPESEILALRDQLQALPEVISVEYISREDALAAFREEHQNDQLTLQALDELGENPLGAVLNVQAQEIPQYEGIAGFIQGDKVLGEGGAQYVEKINYYDERHRNAVETLERYTTTAQWVGAVLIAIFVIATIAISFNTLRLAIYSSREEIHVMRLVGAGKGYIRAPFVVEGILYGLVAGLITLILFYPLAWWMGSATENFFGGVNIFTYYLTTFPLFFASIMGSGIVLGAIASFLAVRRYLNV